MNDSLKSFFTKNIGWKLASLLLGLVIWAVITNSQNPVQTKNISVPITYLNEEQLLAKDNLIFMSGPETVTIVAKAQNSALSGVTSSLFRCTADLMDHSGGDIANQRVHVTVTEVSTDSPVLDWSYYRNDPNITVVMDEQISKTFDIQLLPEDSLTEGLILEGSVEFDPASVTVTGPKTRFTDLAGVKAAVNMKELSDEGGGKIQKAVELKLYDANNKQIPNLDGALKLSNTMALMSATVDRLQTVTVIVSGTVGTPAEGYRYLASSVSPSTITVQGLKSNVADFSELYIDPEAIDISGISGKKDYLVDISPYLPEGVKLSGSDGIVTVSVEVEPVESRTFEIRPGNIELKNMDEELYEYAFKDMNVEVVVTGFEEDLDVFRVSKLFPTADAAGLEPGTHLVHVSIAHVPGYKIENEDELEIYLIVKEKEISSSESSSEEESETQSESEEETSGAPGESTAENPEGSVPEETGTSAEKESEEATTQVPEETAGEG